MVQVKVRTMSQTKVDIAKVLPLVASGKVRELYQVDANTLLFAASDRISAYDVIMDNVSLKSFCKCPNAIAEALR